MLNAHGRRWTLGLLAGLLLPVVLPSSAPAATAPVGSGPAMLSARGPRTDALSCSGDLNTSERPPVLLVPGTGLTPQENWGPTYVPVLRERGHSVCLVRLPDRGTRDVQANAEYVAWAIRTLGQWSERRISVIGQSQGALLPQVALRTWQDLPVHVDDVIGLAGVYDHGSADLIRRCREKCTPVLHQLAAGSRFLEQISRRLLPLGPSYTNIGASGDLTVTPQPTANQQKRARSLMVQDVCPGHEVAEPQHAMIAGDAVALALVLDALDHRGTASPGRIDPATCDQQQYPEFDEAAYRAAADQQVRGAAPVAEEPALYCRHRAACRSPRLRGQLVSHVHYTVRRHRVVVRGTAQLTGRVRLVLGRRVVATEVVPGPFVLRLPRSVRRDRLAVQTRPVYFRAWATEAGRSVPGRGPKR